MMAGEGESMHGADICASAVSSRRSTAAPTRPRSGPRPTGGTSASTRRPPSSVPPNRFWRDLAAHRRGRRSCRRTSASAPSSFAEALSALAFLDLPFVAAAHDLRRRRLPPHASPRRATRLAARTRIAPIDAAANSAAPILVGQSYFRADDRWAWDGAEQREKSVTGELLAGVVYAVPVVVTNPTSAAQRLDVLLQIPRGAVPVPSGFLTRTVHLHLGPYGT